MIVHDSMPNTDADGLLTGDKFPLLRRLATASLTVMLIAATALILLYWQDQLSEHKAIAEQENEKTLNYLARALNEEFYALFASSNAADTHAIKIGSKIDLLITSALEMLQASDFLKLQIYNQSGVIIYSTFRGDLGGTSSHPDWQAKALRGETVHNIESRDVFIGINGEMHDIRVALTYMPLTHDGKRIGVIETYRDVTALYKHRQSKVIEIALIVFAAFALLYAMLIFIVFRTDRDVVKWQRLLVESQLRFQTLFDFSNDGLFIINMQGNFIDINKTAYERLGYSKKEMLAMKLTELDPPEFAAKVSKRLDRIIKHGMAVFETAHYHKDGSIMPVEINARIIELDGEKVFFSVVRDITERKQAVIALHESEARFRSLIESSQDGILAYDKDIRYTIWNPAMERIAGIKAEELMGKNPFDVFPFLEEVGEGDAFREAVQGNASKLSAMPFDIPETDRKGWYESSHFPLFDTSQNVIGGMAIIRDVTERKETERKANMLLQAVEKSGESMMITNKDAIIEYVNPAFTKITGYSLEEVVGKTPAVLKSHAQNPAFYEELWGTITRGEVWHGTLVDKKKDGSFFPALTSIAPIHNGDEKITHYVAIQQDVTEYKKMEEQFLQAQKMEAIGTLVGGIAHDFNNMLAAIQGNVYLVKRGLKNQPELDDKMDSIDKLGMRAAEMVKQLLTFARKDQIKLHALSLNPFIKEAHTLAKTAIPENIDFVCEISQEELAIKGDATQLQQVLMNLLNNARDAVFYVSQPKISCALKSFVATADFVKAHPDIKDKNFAELIVGDNGQGIEAAHLEKVFEPFFTTKGVGEGTGLGLAMVYGAIKSHGGVIEVESKKGVGTTFHVYLPLTENVEDLVQQEASDISQGRGETILLVDDEEDMRITSGEVFRDLGYQVLTAGDGEEALQTFRDHRKDIRLIISDVVMPKMGGADLAKAIRQLDKKLPIIFATGYAKDQAMPAEEQVELSTIISKPFSYKKLSQLIRRLIDAN